MNSKGLALARVALRQNTALSLLRPTSLVARRFIATESTSQDAGYQILVKQRLNRPVSPHLGIYQPQITWYLSILTRITGGILSGTVYVFATAYLVAPVLGWHLESASMAAAFAAWPVAAKVAVKLGLAFPFTFHALNGLRHLAWDSGAGFVNAQVNRTGWIVVGLTALSTAWLAFAY